MLFRSLFSAAQPLEDFEKIVEAAKKIPPKKPFIPENPPIIRPKAAMEPREALFSPAETVPLEKAAGRILADINTPCPPCVPIIMPGEIIDAEVLGALCGYGVESLRVVK